MRPMHLLTTNENVKDNKSNLLISHSQQRLTEPPTADELINSIIPLID